MTNSNSEHGKTHACHVENITAQSLADGSDKVNDRLARHQMELVDDDNEAITSNPPLSYYFHIRFVGTVLAAWLQYLAGYAGYTVPVNILAIINQDIGPYANYTWVSIVWSLCSAIAFLLLGRLSDLFGRRWFFIAGAVIGLVGSIMASRASSIPALIGSTALLGLASGPQVSYSLVYSELIPNKYRSIVNGVMALATAPLSIFGPVVIRSFVRHTSSGWRWSYYLAIILNTISIVLYYLCYYPPTFQLLHAHETRVSRWKMIDLLGILSFTAGLLLFLLSLSWGGSIYPWKSGIVIGVMISGFLIFVFFIYWEIYGAGQYALVPMKLFLNRGFVGMILTSGVAFMVYLALTVLFPTQLTLLYAGSSMEIGWKSCIVQAGSIGGDFLGGLLLWRFKKHDLQLIVYSVMITAFTGAMAASKPDRQPLALAFAFLSATQAGTLGNAALSLTPLCLGEEDIGIALGLIGTSRAAFSAIGQAVFIAVLNSGLEKKIPTYVASAVGDATLPHSEVLTLIDNLAAGNLTGLADLSPSVASAAMNAYKMAYSDSFSLVYLSSIAFGACAVVAAFLVPNLENKLGSGVARTLQVGMRESKGGHSNKGVNAETSGELKD